jgi:hypothetical protein
VFACMVRPNTFLKMNMSGAPRACLHGFVLPEVGLERDAVLNLRGDPADDLLGQVPFAADVTGRRNENLVLSHKRRVGALQGSGDLPSGAGRPKEGA